MASPYLRKDLEIRKINKNVITRFTDRSEHGLVVKCSGVLEEGNDFEMQIRPLNSSNCVTCGRVFRGSEFLFAGFDDGVACITFNLKQAFHDATTPREVVEYAIPAVADLELKPLSDFQNRDI